MPYKIYPTAAADASTAFQIELDPRAIEAMEEIENSGHRGQRVRRSYESISAQTMTKATGGQLMDFTEFPKV